MSFAQVHSSGTLDDLLRQIQKRLRSNIPELGEEDCFVTVEPIPEIAPPGELIVTISPGAYRFPDDFFTGGGFETLMCSGTVDITVLHRTNLDQPTHSPLQLLDEDRGLIARYFPRVLRAMLVTDVTDPNDPQKVVRIAWQPTNKKGEPMLRNHFRPVEVGAPAPTVIGREGGAVGFVAATLSFQADFDWSI